MALKVGLGSVALAAPAETLEPYRCPPVPSSYATYPSLPFPASWLEARGGRARVISALIRGEIIYAANFHLFFNPTKDTLLSNASGCTPNVHPERTRHPHCSASRWHAPQAPAHPRILAPSCAPDHLAHPSRLRIPAIFTRAGQQIRSPPTPSSISNRRLLLQ